MQPRQNPCQKKKKKNRQTKKQTTSTPVAVYPVHPLLDSQHSLPNSLNDIDSDGDFGEGNDPAIDPDALYLGYIPPHKRGSQSLPPDPPSPLSQTPSGRAQMKTTTPQSPSMLPTPQSPQLSLTQNSTQRTLDSPSTALTLYPASLHPTPRQYDLDYEAVLIAISDVNRISRYLFRGGVSSRVDRQDPNVEMNLTREDVVEVLVELREMLNRMFARFPQRFQLNSTVI